MTNVWGIFKKDLNQFRFWLMGLLILGGFAGWFYKNLGGYGLDESTLVAYLLAPVLALAFLYIYLVAAVVINDSPSQDHAFWRTRPLARGEVLLAKLFFIGLLAVSLSAVVFLADPNRSSFLEHELGLNYSKNAHDHSSIVIGGTLESLLLVAALASLARNHKQFVLFLIGVIVLPVFLPQIAGDGAPDWMRPSLKMLQLILIVGILVNQYLTGNQRRSILLMALWIVSLMLY